MSKPGTPKHGAGSSSAAAAPEKISVSSDIAVYRQEDSFSKSASWLIWDAEHQNTIISCSTSLPSVKCVNALF